MADSFDFDDIFKIPASSQKRKSGSSNGKIGGSMNWGLLLDPSSSSPDKRVKATAASKAVAAINEVSELASPARMNATSNEVTPLRMMEKEDKTPTKQLGRVGHVAVEINGKMYVHGGETDCGVTLGDILVFDVSACSMTTLLCEGPTRLSSYRNFISKSF
jgi:hypothetical protein